MDKLSQIDERRLRLLEQRLSGNSSDAIDTQVSVKKNNLFKGKIQKKRKKTPLEKNRIFTIFIFFHFTIKPTNTTTDRRKKRNFTPEEDDLIFEVRFLY